MEIVSKIQSLSDAELCKKLSIIRQTERDVLSDFLLHLCELDKRKSYLELGFGSVYSYLRYGLGYSESSATRRILAARVLKETPDVYLKLRTGKLTLSAVTEIAKVKDAEAQRTLLTTAEGQSSRDVERLVAQHLPATARKRERTKARKVAPPAATPLLSSQVIDRTPPAPAVTVYSMYMEFDEETMRVFSEGKALVGGGKNSEVVRKVFSEFVEWKSPRNREERRAKRAVKKAEKAKEASTMAQKTENETPKTVRTTGPTMRRISRQIPAALRDKITIRDQGRCTFVGPDGRRCMETQHLEVDHVQLFSFGGRHTEENLRLLCRPHNQLMAERALGKEKMQRMKARR